MATRQELARALRRDLLDIHGVAELLGVSRSSVNTLMVRPSTGFPRPIYETSGDHRHPVRLWYRADVETWIQNRHR